MILLIVIAMIIMILFITYQNNAEKFEVTEAIQTLSSMYSSGSIKSNKMEIGDKIEIVPVSTPEYDGLYVKSKSGNAKDGGLRAENLSVDKNLRVIKGVHFSDTLVNDGKITAKGGLTVPDANVYTVGFNTQSGDLSNGRSKNGLTDNQLTQLCRNHPRCDRYRVEGDTVWFKEQNNMDWILWHTTFPDNYYVWGSTPDEPYKTIPNSNLTDCQTACNNEKPTCTYIQLGKDKICGLKKDNASDTSNKTVFVAKSFN